MKRKRKKAAEPTPEQRMVDFTRRLLNVSKRELDDLRQAEQPKKRGR